MFFQIVLLFVVQLALPAYFLYMLWNGRDATRLEWLSRASYVSVFVLYVFLAGRWDWLSYHLRFAWIALLAVVLVASYRRVRDAPWIDQPDRRWWLNLGGGVVVLLVFTGFLAAVLRGYLYPDRPVQLAFPLQDGWYYTAQGGNSPLLNHHNTHPSQRYGIDIVELNAFGARASGIYPSGLERYVIFGETVHSPCSGTVGKVVDGLSDQAPPETDRDHPAGNHVVVACRGVNVLLAHLHSGSVKVQSGESVETGQPLGLVGNSGNTTEPHLHIHAVRPGDSGESAAGDGVPLSFGGKDAVRNALFLRPRAGFHDTRR